MRAMEPTSPLQKCELTPISKKAKKKDLILWSFYVEIDPYLFPLLNSGKIHSNYFYFCLALSFLLH